MTDEQRNAMIDQILPLFIKWNQGDKPSEYIENLWSKMSQENLQLALDNFTRMDEESDESESVPSLSYTQRDELTHSLVYKELESMDRDQLERYFLENQIDCYDKNYTDAELLTEMKEYYDEDEFSEIMAELAQ
jgi:uncharacterized membrane-anchored protein YjiN (DUF445 family)